MSKSTNDTSDPNIMNLEARQALYTEERRHLDEIIKLIAKWPAYRAHFACGLLGSVVAICDSLGIDVDGWLARLRKHVPKPSVRAPFHVIEDSKLNRDELTVIAQRLADTYPRRKLRVVTIVTDESGDFVGVGMNTSFSDACNMFRCASTGDDVVFHSTAPVQEEGARTTCPTDR